MKKLVLLICVLVLIVGCNPTFDGPTKFNPRDPDVGTPNAGSVTVPGEATLLISPSPASPSFDRFTLTLTDVPVGTDKVWFSVVPSGAGDTVSPNAGVDRDGSDGYSVSVNKLNYGAGLHDVAAIAWDDATSIATVSTQITIVQATVDPGDFAILP